MKRKDKKYILSIESSCDESAASILSNEGLIISNGLYSSSKIHNQYGGIVPEIAIKHQGSVIPMLIQKIINTSGIKKSNLIIISVTAGPGLTGPLLSGIQFAKGFALSNNSFFLGIHHIEGHIGINQNIIADKNNNLFTVISGGHSNTYTIKNNIIIILGETRDDSSGEIFDKIARILNLPYPGGPIINIMSKLGNSNQYKFIIGLKRKKTLDYSFSGIKTSTYNLIKIIQKKNCTIKKPIALHICASFQKTVILSILNKILLACRQKNIVKVFFGGGVAANSRLRQFSKKTYLKTGIKFFFPKKKFCTDNAIMIAKIALNKIKTYKVSALAMPTYPKISIKNKNIISV